MSAICLKRILSILKVIHVNTKMLHPIFRIMKCKLWEAG